MNKAYSPSRLVVYAAMIAGLYAVLVYAGAAFGYGPIQLRFADVLKPLALLSPLFSIGFGLGMLLANLGSPFGAWDFVAMPLVGILASLIMWRLRKVPLVALVTHSLVISVGVSFFPLGLGGALPFWLTFPGVLISQLLIVIASYYTIWKWVFIALERRMVQGEKA